MSRRSEFSQDLETIWVIYHLSYENYLYSKYMHNPPTTDEKNYIFRLRDWVFIMQMIFRVAMIELDKLTSDSENQRYNIANFLKKLGRNGHYRSLKVDGVLLEKWQSFIDQNRNTFTTIKILRNKRYAHTDGNVKSIEENLTIDWPELDKVYEFIRDVIRTLYSEVLDSQAEIRPFFDETRFPYFKILAEDSNQKMLAFLGPKFRLEKDK